MHVWMPSGGFQCWCTRLLLAHAGCGMLMRRLQAVTAAALEKARRGMELVLHAAAGDAGAAGKKINFRELRIL